MRKKLLLLAVGLSFFGTDPLGLGAVTLAPAATDDWSAPVAFVPVQRDKAINTSDSDKREYTASHRA